MGLRVSRLVIVIGYVVVGLGVAFYFVGPYAFIPAPGLIFFSVPVWEWVNGTRTRARVAEEVMTQGRDALTSDQMEFMFRDRKPTVIDNDKAWGKFVEGRDTIFGGNIAAVQVTNATPEPDGTYKQVWLRVPSRGDRMGARMCTHAACGKDISWPPRTAREAVAWTFRLCVDHYEPAKAS